MGRAPRSSVLSARLWRQSLWIQIPAMAMWCFSWLFSSIQLVVLYRVVLL